MKKKKGRYKCDRCGNNTHILYGSENKSSEICEECWEQEEKKGKNR